MGIAIKLSGQDFTDSVLGRVTFKKSSAEVAADYVAAYSTAIGTTAYNSALLTMFTALVANGLDEKMFAIYPMLGNSLNSLKVNALSPGENDLSLFANASAGANKLVFVNTIGIGDKQSAVVRLGDDTDDNYSWLTVFKRDWNINSSTLFYFNSPVVASISAKVNTANDGGQAVIVSNYRASDYTKVISADTATIWTLMGVNSQALAEGTINGTDYSVASDNVIAERWPRPNTFLGGDFYAGASTAEGETISSNANIWNGESYFHAIGNLTKAENAQLKQIVAAFLSEVKEITIQ